MNDLIQEFRQWWQRRTIRQASARLDRIQQELDALLDERDRAEAALVAAMNGGSK